MKQFVIIWNAEDMKDAFAARGKTITLEQAEEILNKNWRGIEECLVESGNELLDSIAEMTVL